MDNRDRSIGDEDFDYGRDDDVSCRRLQSLPFGRNMHPLAQQEDIYDGYEATRSTAVANQPHDEVLVLGSHARVIRIYRCCAGGGTERIRELWQGS